MKYDEADLESCAKIARERYIAFANLRGNSTVSSGGGDVEEANLNVAK